MVPSSQKPRVRYTRAPSIHPCSLGATIASGRGNTASPGTISAACALPCAGILTSGRMPYCADLRMRATNSCDASWLICPLCTALFERVQHPLHARRIPRPLQRIVAGLHREHRRLPEVIAVANALHPEVVR